MSLGWANVLKSKFAPFRHKEFLIFYLAQSLSLLGSWMQELARSWIVLSIDGRSSSMGALLFAQAVPNLLLVGFAGSLADRYSTKRILVTTQALLSILALTLGLWVTHGSINLATLIVFSILEGLVVTFDIPALNLVTPRLVPRVDFQQALALNSVNFHLSRVLGPALAGVVMAHFGPESVFFANSVSFLGLIFVFAKLPLNARLQSQELKPDTTNSRNGLSDTALDRAKNSGGMREVFVYLKTHPVFFQIMIQFLLVITLVFPLLFTTLRVLVKERFAISAEDFGLVFAAPGVGALLGSLTFLLLSPKNPMKILPLSLAGVVGGLILIAESFSLVLMVTVFIGFSFMMFLTLSALLVTVQLQVADQIRGRVSALIGMCFVTLSPMMTVPVGYVSDWMGEKQLLWFVALSFGFISLTVQTFFRRRGSK